MNFTYQQAHNKACEKIGGIEHENWYNCGATGKAGSLIVKEASERGHEVTAIVRNAAKLAGEKVAVLEKDVFDLKAEDLQAFDVVVNAFGAPAGQEHLHVDAGKSFD